MKFCPYCGADLPDDTAAFCMECGKSIPSKAVQEDIPVKKKRKRKRMKEKPTQPVPEPEDTVKPQDEGYDGYYDDVLPEDMGMIRREMDPQLIKKVAALAIGAILIIIACVAIMYLL